MNRLAVWIIVAILTLGFLWGCVATSRADAAGIYWSPCQVRVRSGDNYLSAWKTVDPTKYPELCTRRYPQPPGPVNPAPPPPPTATRLP